MMDMGRIHSDHEEKTCAICGKPFDAHAPNAKYCPSCRAGQKNKYMELACERTTLKQQTEKLQSAMKRLSKEEQEAIRLFFFEGMNHEAIARTQMWSLRTCKRRVNDAVHKVALMLFGNRSKQTVAFV